MKLKIFIDSDIILDVLALREPFYKSAAALFSLVERRKVEGFTSPIVFSNIHHILRKRVSRQITLETLKEINNLLYILPVDKRTIELALDSSSEDFEDAIQYHCAEQNRINYFITRNKPDYQKAKITLLNAHEFITMFRTLESA